MEIRGVGALLLGYYKDGQLIYAGRTGTGFTQKTHRLLRDKLEAAGAEGGSLCSRPGGCEARSYLGQAGDGGAGTVCYLDGG